MISNLDYANAILVGLPIKELNKLQRVQNRAAKVILNRSKYDSVTECFLQLHWLPIMYRIDYKVILTVYKALHEQAPSYLVDLLCKVPSSGYRLRSRTENNLIVPFAEHKTFADRAFSVRGPKLWNDLPEY